MVEQQTNLSPHQHINIEYQTYTEISCPCCRKSMNIYDNHDAHITNFVVFHTKVCDASSFQVRRWIESELIN